MQHVYVRVIVAMLAAMHLGSAGAQVAPVVRATAVYPVAAWAGTCWPAKGGDSVVTAETDYGYMHAWLCADGSWSGIVRPKAPVVDPLQAAYLESAILPKLEAIRPPVVSWVVAPNGTSTTRPAYALTNGVLLLNAARATVGNACDLARGKYVNGSTTYGAIPQPAGQTPVLVAVCKVK